MKRLLKPFVLLAVAGLLTFAEVPLSASAQINLNDLRAPVIPGSDLISVIARLIRNVFLLWAGIIAFLFALYGGFIYLTAGGDPAKAQQGQRTLMNAVIGIIIIFISYALITYVINVLSGRETTPAPNNIENQIRGTESNPENTNRGTESNPENTNRGTTTNPENTNRGSGTTNNQFQEIPLPGSTSSPQTCQPGVLVC